MACDKRERDNGRPLTRRGTIAPRRCIIDIIDRPLTPFSFAGAARRTAYRGASYADAPPRQMMGVLQSLTGVLLFGLTTALPFAMIQTVRQPGRDTRGRTAGAFTRAMNCRFRVLH